MRGDENTLSRRNFLKNLGMAGAAASVAGTVGLAAAGDALGAPMSGGVHRRPWWVRQVDEPTTGINWDGIQRFNASYTLQPEGLGRYATPEENARLSSIRQARERERIEREEPGYTLKDDALQRAFQSSRNAQHRSFLGPQTALRPEDRGLGRWIGTREENTRTLKVALQQMGAAISGVVHLDDRTRRLIYSVDLDGKPIDFEDVELGYEDEERRVIPNRAEWLVVFAVQMSDMAMKRAPTKLAQMATADAYQRGLMVQTNAQEFLRGLGYQAMGEAVQNGLGIAPAFAVLAGLGELSRLNRVITPEFGPMVRLFKFITDLPLVPDKPIDAGIARFCKTCKKCAEACPPSALSFDTEPGWQPVGGWANPGHQAWFEDSLLCKRYWQEEAGTNCGICFAVCPFSKRNTSFMHDLVRMQIAVSPTFNEITRNMDDAFGYGVRKSPEDWWESDLPEYGIDTGKD